jgi:hypothetical protein
MKEEFAANRILALLPPHEAEAIFPHLQPVELHLGDIVDRPGELIQYLHFPLHAAISITDILDERHTVEVTMTGSEGASGASVVQGSDRAVCMAMVQIGGPTVRLPTAALISELPRLPYLQGALQRYNGLLLRHAVISVGCNRFHSDRQRLARWLKAHWDRTGVEIFPFTLEFLGAQVGLDRQTMGELVDDLQRHGIVTKTHHSITITDQKGLTDACCDCFAYCRDATSQYVAALEHIPRAGWESDLTAP